MSNGFSPAALMLAMLLAATSMPAADLITGLGSPPGNTAGTYAGGFGENAFPKELDESRAVDVTSVFPIGIRFGGELHKTMYINGHGNVTFKSPDRLGMVPSKIQATALLPRIAPFFADTDPGPAGVFASPGGKSRGTNRIYWDLDAKEGIITVTWDDVGYYSENIDKLNAYQLRLIRVGDLGEFDIEFRYEWIGWTSGDGSSYQQGTNGYGGIIARAGFTAGNGTNFYELPQSGRQGSIPTDTLDPPGTDLATAGGMLDLAQLTNVGIPGVFQFQIRRPRITITPASGYTNGDPIVFTFTFDHPVTGFAASDISVTNGTVGALTTITPGLVYQVQVNPTADGEVTVTVAENSATNSSGNGNPLTTVTVISDRTPPTVVITPTGGTEFNTPKVTFTVIFSEPMINLVAEDFLTDNGAPVRLTGSGTNWSVTIASAADAAMNLTLPMAACTDRAGNTLAANGSAQVMIDVTGPSVSVTHSLTSNLTNSTAPVTFTFDFSDPVVGFTASDIVVSNGTAGAFATVDASSYTLSVTPTTDGLVSVTVPAGVATDDDGLGNLSGTNAFTLDRAAPSVAITAPATITGSGVFLFVFSEPMIGFDSTDLTITGGSAGSVELVPGTSATYRATITANGSGNVVVTVNRTSGLTDRAGNQLGSATSTAVTYIAGLAGLTITTSATEPNTAAKIPVTFTFAGAATGFTIGDIAISNGSAGTLVEGGAGSYTMEVTPAGRGLVTISVAANACTVGGVGNRSANLIVNHDPAGPLPRFSIAPITGGRPGQSIWITITFDEDVNGIDANDFVITNGTIVDDEVYELVPNRVYQVEVAIAPRPNTTGTVTLIAGAATGANNRASQAATIELVEPIIPPTVGGDRKCGLGSGLALLLMWLFMGLNGRARFIRRD